MAEKHHRHPDYDVRGDGSYGYDWEYKAVCGAWVSSEEIYSVGNVANGVPVTCTACILTKFQIEAEDDSSHPTV